jgi:hypothetical protein
MKIERLHQKKVKIGKPVTRPFWQVLFLLPDKEFRSVNSLSFQLGPDYILGFLAGHSKKIVF